MANLLAALFAGLGQGGQQLLTHRRFTKEQDESKRRYDEGMGLERRKFASGEEHDRRMEALTDQARQQDAAQFNASYALNKAAQDQQRVNNSFERGRANRQDFESGVDRLSKHYDQMDFSLNPDLARRAITGQRMSGLGDPTKAGGTGIEDIGNNLARAGQKMSQTNGLPSDDLVANALNMTSRTNRAVAVPGMGVARYPYNPESGSFGSVYGSTLDAQRDDAELIRKTMDMYAKAVLDKYGPDNPIFPRTAEQNGQMKAEYEAALNAGKAYGEQLVRENRGRAPKTSPPPAPVAPAGPIMPKGSYPGVGGDLQARPATPGSVPSGNFSRFFH